MGRKRGVLRKLKLRELFNEQSGFCAYCKCEMTLDLGCDNTAEIEHVVPKSMLKDKEMYDMDHNLVAACHDCNHHKADMPVRHWLMLSQPRFLFKDYCND